MKKLLSGGLLLLLLSSTSYAEMASSESVKNLMIKTGVGNISMQLMNQMLPALKQMIPEAPDEFWNDMMAEIDGNQIIDMTVPVYQKYLSQEDIDALNKFYDTPAGKKMISVQPQIMQESMAVGQAWGQQIATQVLKKYQAQKSN